KLGCPSGVGSWRSAGLTAFFAPLVIEQRERTGAPQKRKQIMRAVPIRPLNAHACTGRHVHLARLGISRTRHNFSIAQLRAGLSVRVKNALGTGLRCTMQ